ncbi:MAG: hypothetical protein LBR90_02355 [Elusimicrobiota bacterium]|jgi:hypothetical protein|nr:hypothetical protein [Elusimicrobiota bacterium]
MTPPEEKQPVSVNIRRIELDDVWFDGVGPLEVKALARDVELRMEKISKDKNIADTFKILAHAALHYAVLAYSKTNTAGTKSKDENKQLDNAIEKLSHCLNGLPLK